MLPVHQAAIEDFEAVNTLIIKQLHSEVDEVENIGHYIIDAGGKRLRPLLVLLSAKALGYQGDQHISLAAIIEFIHTATLLHDDVVDTSDLRRGRATANSKFGNAPSVLVGDFLYSRAFQMLVSISNMSIMRIMADATNIISEGEVQQLINAGNPDVSEEDYSEVIRKKTAELFDAAAHIGASITDSSPEMIKQLSQYGHHLGMTFQLMDDFLDYQGNAEELGKNVGDDLAEGKPTLPLIYTMKHGSATDAETIRQAIADASDKNLDHVVEIIHRSGGLDYTFEQADRHRNLALQSLRGLEPSKYLNALIELANFAIERKF